MIDHPQKSKKSKATTVYQPSIDIILNVQALRVESGVWDTVTRIDMLVMRFSTKICSLDPGITDFSSG